MAWLTHAMAWALVALTVAGIVASPFLRFIFGAMSASLVEQAAGRPILFGAFSVATAALCVGVGFVLDRKGWPATICGIVFAACIGLVAAVG